MREPSASLLALVQHCQHPFTSGIKWPWEPQNRYTGLGNLVDHLIEKHVEGTAAAPEGLDALTETETKKAHRLAGFAIGMLEDERRANKYTWSNAQAFLRYNVDAGTARASKGPGPKMAGEWTCKADWVGGRDGCMCVRDWKTGRQQFTGAIRQNPQMRLGAIAASRAYGIDNVCVELVYLDDDGITIDGAEFDPFDIADIYHEMKALRAKLLNGPTPPVPGPWCTQHYCKLKGICAATKAALANAYPLEDALTHEIRDEDHARWILARLPGAKAALKAVEDAVDDYAKSKPVHLADGTMYGQVERESRSVSVDTEEKRAALASVLGRHADTAVRTEHSATLGTIKEAARKCVEAGDDGRSAAAIAREAVEALTEAGGVKVSTYRRMDTFKPRDDGDTEGLES